MLVMAQADACAWKRVAIIKTAILNTLNLSENKKVLSV
jgi:hypothetical protein